MRVVVKRHVAGNDELVQRQRFNDPCRLCDCIGCCAHKLHHLGLLQIFNRLLHLLLSSTELLLNNRGRKLVNRQPFWGAMVVLVRFLGSSFSGRAGSFCGLGRGRGGGGGGGGRGGFEIKIVVESVW